eukprot:GFUD01016066.1.p1 GENE.GFUD01016066.1~~GFUD01016066.1.p1  ORF type:complete len:164 (-),score=30.98 GFUD01016066.1:53-544(-)
MWTSVLCCWESTVLSEVCKDGAGSNLQRAHASMMALIDFDDDYLWMVVVSNNNAGFATSGHSGYWNNICGKDILVWRINKEHAGSVCSSVLRERAKFIINRETSGSFATSRDNIKRRLASAGINHDGFVVYDSSQGDHAAVKYTACFVDQAENGKQIVIFLDN